MTLQTFVLIIILFPWAISLIIKKDKFRRQSIIELIFQKMLTVPLSLTS